MEITEIKVFPTRDDGRLKAYATVVFDNCFIIRDLKVIEGHKGLFVSMPSELGKNDRWYERVRCLNQGVKELIESKVLDAYQAQESNF